MTRLPPTRRNERGALDCLQARRAEKRPCRVLPLVDESSWDAPALGAEPSLPGARVVEVLERLAETRGLPQTLRIDTGPACAGSVLAAWAARRGSPLHCIEPGKPTQNGSAESCNGRFRAACLPEPWFPTLAEAPHRIEAWRPDDPTVRPHRSLGARTPAEFVEKDSTYN